MKNIICEANQEDYPEMIAVWESSVNATHDFLSEEDFNFYKNLMPTFFDNVKLKVIKSDTKTILGFMGTANDSLEMLFIADAERGKGIGKRLLLYAIENLGITRVDVNQENHQAVNFYHQFGFVTKGVSATDGFGKPYPILHLELQK